MTRIFCRLFGHRWIHNGPDEWVLDVCTRCGICFVRCPDGAIALDERGYPIIDYDHCKGCMECWDQCPVPGGIRKEKEVRAW